MNCYLFSTFAKTRRAACWLLALFSLALLAAPASAESAESSAEIPVLDLNALLAAAAREPDSVVKLPAGTYRLPPNPVVVRNARNLRIEGYETTLLLTQFEHTGLRFEDCEGIQLAGITFDYDPLPFTQGTIVEKSADESVIEVEIQEGYPDVSAKYNTSRIHMFDGETLGWKRGAAEGFSEEIEILNPRKARVKLARHMVARGQAQLLDVGDIVVFSMRAGALITFFRTNDILVEDVTMYSSPGLGIVARNCNGDNRFLRVKALRGPTPQNAGVPRLLSLNCDALNYAYSRSGARIEDCEFSFMGDDGINLHGPAFMIVHVESPNIIWCLRNTVLPEIRRYYDNIILPEDPVRILAEDNFAIKEILAVQTLETDIEPPFELSREDARRAAPLSEYPTEKFLRITLAEPTNAKAGDVIDFPNANSPGYVIRNNRIHDVRPRGMRIMASDGIIENNYIARTTQPAICLGGHYAHYREAGWVDNVIVRNNFIEDIGLGASINLDLAVSPGAINVWTEIAHGAVRSTPAGRNHAGVKIVDNTIVNTSDEAIMVSGLTKGVIAGNIIVNSNLTSPTRKLLNKSVPRGYAIVVMDSDVVELSDNMIIDEQGTHQGAVYITEER